MEKFQKPNLMSTTSTWEKFCNLLGRAPYYVYGRGERESQRLSFSLKTWDLLAMPTKEGKGILCLDSL
jgi:hypothetical protein